MLERSSAFAILEGKRIVSSVIIIFGLFKNRCAIVRVLSGRRQCRQHIFSRLFRNLIVFRLKIAATFNGATTKDSRRSSVTGSSSLSMFCLHFSRLDHSEKYQLSSKKSQERKKILALAVAYLCVPSITLA